VLVGEVVWEDDPDKDLVRNVELYLQVPSIREYWVLDPLPDSE
jgi:Uma2 family endonuclease